jgi:hypothetical protein
MSLPKTLKRADDFKEGDACPLCGGELAFSPLGECTCWSGAGTSGWSPGQCRPCENGGIFCKKCELFADEIADEFKERALNKTFDEGLAEAPAAANANARKPSPFHRPPPSSGVLAAHELWLPGTRGHRS